MRSVVGGIFNATLQLGATAGLAINATIQAAFPSSDNHSNGAHSIAWKGYESTFIWMTVLCVVVAILSGIWFKNPIEGDSEVEVRVKEGERI